MIAIGQQNSDVDIQGGGEPPRSGGAERQAMKRLETTILTLADISEIVAEKQA